MPDLLGRFRWIVFAAVCAGVVAGAAMSLVHHFVLVPLIERAEVFEDAAAAKAAQASVALAASTAQASAAQATQPAPAAQPGHDHAGGDAHAPTGAQRAVLTLITDLLAAIGFALMLAAGLTLRGGNVSWRAGLAWGLSGFLAFSLAPSLGLPPELPGAEGAPLVGRQFWWLATVAATATGLALLAFGYRLVLAVTGIALIVAPHIIGAPRPPPEDPVVPAELTRQFIIAVLTTNLGFWLLLGCACVHFLRRFAPTIVPPMHRSAMGGPVP
jgi:cobalt transporter subunit CbtA